MWWYRVRAQNSSGLETNIPPLPKAHAGRMRQRLERYAASTRRGKKFMIPLWGGLLMASIVAHGDAETLIITQFGVTFYFAEPVVHGTFANGDYWVLAPVTVTRMTPDWDGIRHGWEINPKVEVAQGFDARGAGYHSAKRPPLPLTLTTNCSLVKVVGHSDSVDGSYVKTAVVLTVLTSKPERGGSDYFRPPYCGDVKLLIPSNALRTSLLPRYPMPASAPSLSTVASNFAQCLRMDHHPTHPRFFRPTDAMAGYQPENTTQLNDAMLRLMGDDELAAKWQALVLFTQHALDRAVIVTQGYRQGGTGHNPNHRVVAAWAALLLGMEEVQKYLAVAEGFHEDTFLYDSPVDGRALWGEAASERQYWDYLMGLGGSRSRRDPYGFIDGGRLTDGPGGHINLLPHRVSRDRR